MPFELDHNASAEEQEASLLLNADELMEKAASAAPPEAEFVVEAEESRFEERLPESPEEEEEEEPTISDVWSREPSVKDQALRYPDSVRMVDTETKIFDLAIPEQLEEFNKIQRGDSDPTAPTYGILGIDDQKHNGSWTVKVTFCRIEYLKL